MMLSMTSSRSPGFGSTSRAAVLVAIVPLLVRGIGGRSVDDEAQALPERYPWVDSPSMTASPDLAAASELVAATDRVIAGAVDAFAEGATAQGADVVRIGQTELRYER